MRTHFLLLFAITICIALGCQPDKPESATKGNLHVLISESDAPALVEQVNAFMGIYGKNGANVTYSVTSSDEAIDKLINDTIRCIFTTRPLTADERKTFDANPKELVEIVVAYDGLAAVVHHKNPIEQMTTKEVEGILKGTITRWEQLSHPATMKGRIELFMQDSSDVTMFLQKRILHGASLNKATHRTRSSLQT
ncbi:MAG: substrate-binding domain-containing protein, partial [Ignavibacteriales bacterium]|nr:substrate-binding domain-containing protein [Ignavibacteriales bacterium]